MASGTLQAAEIEYATLPAPPTSSLTEYGDGLALKLSTACHALASDFRAAEEKRELIHRSSRDLQRQTSSALMLLRNGRLPEAKAELTACLEALKSTPPELLAPQPERDGRIASVHEDVVCVQGFLAFFDTGRLLSRASVVASTEDSEYLGGVIQTAQELVGYAVGRAMEHDIASIMLCRISSRPSTESS